MLTEWGLFTRGFTLHSFSVVCVCIWIWYWSNEAVSPWGFLCGYEMLAGWCLFAGDSCSIKLSHLLFSVSFWILGADRSGESENAYTGEMLRWPRSPQSSGDRIPIPSWLVLFYDCPRRRQSVAVVARRAWSTPIYFLKTTKQRLIIIAHRPSQSQYDFRPLVPVSRINAENQSWLA
jgi:hypothetical protein